MLSTSQKPSGSCVEEVKDPKGNTVAVKFSITCMEGEGTWIPTPTSWGIQVGIFKHSKGYSVGAHTHPRERRDKHSGCEALYVIKGCLKVELYDEEGRVLGNTTLGEGECLVMACGHSVEVLDDALVLEIKEGPYPGLRYDKRWLRASP